MKRSPPSGCSSGIRAHRRTSSSTANRSCHRRRSCKALPPALDVVLVTALSPKPENRYQDSVAFADALRQVAHRHGLLSSAPQLAEHLRYILGGDSDKWLTDEKVAATGDPSTQKIPGKELERKRGRSPRSVSWRRPTCTS